MGTFDIMKGRKPPARKRTRRCRSCRTRDRSKHASAYKERGVRTKAGSDALEIERSSATRRKRASMQPTKEWAFRPSRKPIFSGNVEIIIEDGTLTPKTSLGERAAIDHLAQLGLIDP
jgi:hypothetical protein